MHLIPLQVPSGLLNGTSHNGATPPGHVRVSFHLQRELPLGQVHMLVGSHPALGEWDLRQGLYMGWSEGDVWQSEAWLPPHAALEFKVSQQWSSWWELVWGLCLQLQLSNGPL